MCNRNTYLVSSDILGITDLDSHADTCYFGMNPRVTNYTEKVVSVALLQNNICGTRNTPIFTSAIYYDDPDMYQTYILLFPVSLYLRTRIPISCTILI